MKAAKIAIIFSFILAVAALASSGYLYQQLKTERTEREDAESEKAQIEERAVSLQSQIMQLEEETERFRKQIQDYVDQRESLKAELDEALTGKAELQKKIDALATERDSLANEVSVGEVKEEALVEEANRIVALPSPPQPLLLPPAVKGDEKQEAKKFEVKPEKKEKSAKKKEEKVKAPAVEKTVTPPAAAPPVVDQRPNQVLSVNRKFNFVVVNMGLRGRLKIGDTLRVEQNGKLIGRVQVEKLYENFSACTILEEIKPAQIQEGDLVRLA